MRRKIFLYNKPVFYDSDCLVCFLVINQCDILQELFSKIIVPLTVKEEILNPRTPDIIKNNFNKLVEIGFVEIREIVYGTYEFDFYDSIKTKNFQKNKLPIGDGEAAVITLGYINKGIVASNNLSDVMDYVKKYGLNLITTAFILAMAYEQNIKTEKELNEIWNKMVDKGRKRSLPKVKSFTDYYSNMYIKDSEFMGYQ